MTRTPRSRRAVRFAIGLALAFACAGCEYVRNEFFFLDVPPPVVSPDAGDPGPRAW